MAIDTTISYRWYFLSLVLLVAGLLFYVWCHVTTLARGERLTVLMDERTALLRTQDMLRAEVTGLERSSRIREIAALELGMRLPHEQPNNLYLAPDVSARVAGLDAAR